MISAVRFWPEHVREILTRPLRHEDEETFGSLARSDIEGAMSTYRERGIAQTIEVRGVAVACVGIVELWPGVGELWGVLDPRLKGTRMGAALVWWGRRRLPEAMESARIRRVQASIRCDDEHTQRLLQSFGFVQEGVMAAYGPEGADYVRLARIAPGADRRH